MKIYSENGSIVFECDWCHERLEIPPQKSKRGFMLKLNPFTRVHDQDCKWKYQRQEKIDNAKSVANEIIGRFVKVNSGD
jgi:hypothetical protein